MLTSLTMRIHPSSLPCTLPGTGSGHTASMIAIAMIGLALGAVLVSVSRRRRLPLVLGLLLFVGVAAVQAPKPATAGCRDRITIVNAGSNYYAIETTKGVLVTPIDVCEQANPTNCVHLLTTDPVGKQYYLTVASSPANLIASELGTGDGTGVQVFDHEPTTTEMDDSGGPATVAYAINCSNSAVTPAWSASNGSDYWVSAHHTC